MCEKIGNVPNLGGPRVVVAFSCRAADLSHITAGISPEEWEEMKDRARGIPDLNHYVAQSTVDALVKELEKESS